MKDTSTTAPIRDRRRLDPQRGSLVPADHRHIIEAGLSALRHAGSPQVDRIEAGWPRALPAIAGMETLVDRAIDVLDGAPGALEDFRDQLEALAARTPRNASHAAALEAASPRQIDGPAYFREILSRLEARRPAGASEPQWPWAVDTVVALAVAAMMAGGDEPHVMHRYLGVLAWQLGQLLRFSSAVRKVERALAGGPDSARIDRALLGLVEDAAYGREIADAAQYIPRWPPLSGAMEIPKKIDEALLWELMARLALLSPLGAMEYQILSISNDRACPGEQIVLTGEGFGSSGKVRFAATGGGDVDTGADEWEPQRIAVTVPGGATAGTLSVRTTVDIGFWWNGHHVERLVHKQARVPAQFRGGQTSFAYLKCAPAGGAGACTPGSTCSILWSSGNADSVDLEVRSQEDGVLLQAQDLPAKGSRQIALPSWTSTRHIHVTAGAIGPCGQATEHLDVRVQRPYALSIHGMEITQAIQRYRSREHLTDPADGGDDNALRLVTDKAAWLRLYLRSGQDAGFEGGRLPGVTGTVRVDRRVGAGWVQVGTLSPMNGPIDAEDGFASYAEERVNTSATLSFFVPAGMMTGRLRFTARVSSAHAVIGGSAERRLEVDVTLQQTLQIAAIAVGYDGDDTASPPNHVTFAAPTAAEIANQTGYALAILPVSETPQVRTIASFNATHPLDGHVDPGGCDPNWDPILQRVQQARTNDGNQDGWLYYGFVTNRIPMTHGNVGCSGGTAAGLIDGDGFTMTHELGHQLGLPHAPCGSVGGVNSAYPLYEPYDQGAPTTDASGVTVWHDASIGEYGLDVNTGRVFSPEDTEDFMSYGGPCWISIYSHGYMIQRQALNPVITSGMVTRSLSKPTTTIPSIVTVLGRRDADGGVHVTSISRVRARIPLAEGRRTGLIAELVDASGRVISAAPLFTLPREAPGATPCACCASSPEKEPRVPYLFRAVLLDADHAAELRIRRGDEVVWQRKRPDRRATFTRAAARRRKGGEVEITWSIDGPKGASGADVWLRWSADGGKTWNGLAVGLQGGKIAIDPRTIPARRVMFELLAHDGFHTSSARTAEIDLPARPPSAAIIHPRQGASLPAGRPLRLRGVILDRGTADPTPEKAAWTLDGEAVGAGLDVWLPAPSPGEHTLELTLPGAEPVRVRFSSVA